MAGASSTTINDLPDVLLSNVIASVTDIRSRNATALVCRKWLLLERSTRTFLTLRGNARDLFMLPSCFRSVMELDLSLLSPWGHPLLSSSSPTDPSLIAHLLRHSFPAVHSLTLYSRNPSTLEVLTPHWPRLKRIKLVRWHQRPQLPPGADLAPVFDNCQVIESLDLSRFYCWTDDVPPVLQSYPLIASNLTSLNLLNPSFAEGFKGQELEVITKACPNLKQLLVFCMFDPRYIGFVGDDAMVSIPKNCPQLSLLHLAEISQSGAANNDEAYSQEDARISVAILIEVFSGLPLLEKLTLDVCNNVRDSGPALEILHSKCPRLRFLKLGHFHGICVPIESKLDGVALCQGLESLSIRNVGDLTDMGLIAIGRGCWRLRKLEVQGCKNITINGMRTVATLLRRTLVDVRISFCKNLSAASSLKAVEPIQDRIERLHIDCVWDSAEQFQCQNGVEYNLDLNNLGEGCHRNEFTDFDEEEMWNKNKKRKCCFDLNHTETPEMKSGGNELYCKAWEKLRYLSLWFSVGELLTPLASMGLEDCPNLEKISIKVEGDSRHFSRPSQREFGLSSLALYPKLSKMHLDCGDTIGYAHTAPSGQMDLSLWERFYLFGIGELSLSELDYWPPQDRDVNQRSLSLPAAGLLQECLSLRKLFIHGTAHEHFMMFLLRIPNLRDVQLREDYYPAPENDMSTEMRADSCSRFEDALNRRVIDD